MGYYIRRYKIPIALNEWIDFIKKDSELTLSENGIIVNPITKKEMPFHISGRAIWNGFELIYDNGKILGGSDDNDELIKKLSEIAAAFSADVYDCGERLGE